MVSHDYKECSFINEYESHHEVPSWHYPFPIISNHECRPFASVSTTHQSTHDSPKLDVVPQYTENWKPALVDPHTANVESPG